MRKRSFFGLSRPRIEYELLPARLPEIECITAAKTVTLLHAKSAGGNLPARVKPGDRVQTGQKIALYADDDEAYVIAPVTGKIVAISPFTGDFGHSYAAISIEIDSDEIFDATFKEISRTPDLEGARKFLLNIPGKPPLDVLAARKDDIHTIIICGVDSDLLIETNQYIVKSRTAALKSGIRVLKEITGIDNIIITTAGESVQGYGHLGARITNINPVYPAALPAMIMQKVLGQVVPAGKTSADLGVCFFRAEAVAALGTAFDSGRIPVIKTLTLITKDGNRRLIETPLGTPIGDILARYGVTLNEADRLVLGGPMTGVAVYSVDHPVLPDTDGILVLDRRRAAYVSDYPCVNCGECVRACPVRIPVNMLVRYLEAGHYEEAAYNYDLECCIECGLCSYVCVSKIPIFQYIKLAKYELGRARQVEEMDV